MTLPSGVFELVADYLPLPRIWHWSLIRLRRRCKLAPYQAVQDISIIMDEIMRDAAIFAGRDQSNLLTKLNRSPQVRVLGYVHVHVSWAMFILRRALGALLSALLIALLG